MTDDLAGAFAGALYRVFTERDLMHGFRDAFIAEAALNDAADFAEIVRDLRVHRPVANPLTNDGDICAACSTEDGVTALWPCVPASAVPEPTDLRALVGHYDIAMRAIRRRHEQWTEGFPGDIEAGHLRQHPETQCFADIDRGELLAIIDCALAATPDHTEGGEEPTHE